ncbi:MAG: tRNA lysidine(34) synthetase TilS [Alphaproteobacteria bacterium]|nr:tRNA lysidine(34) synthetase TilS [Alphaproteobacteria bacterium]
MPIDEIEFGRFLEPFAPLSSKIALAVSGGPDSMALAYCAKRWAQRDLVALIVEHGLRPESPAEAVNVKERLEALGIETEILTWKHDVVHDRVQEKARDARYGLLFEACRRHGTFDLLLAHHQGDQAETVLMRLAKGSGIDGLAGIPPQNMREGVRLLRPFLQVSKARLVATCQTAGVQFVIDPSNASEKYARGRIRKIMPLLEAEGLSVENLSLLAQRAREAKEALEIATRELLKSIATAEQGGCVKLDRAALRAAPRALALRGLAEGLRYVHEEAYPPEYAALSSLLDAVLAPKEEEVRTLYGCIASVSEKKIAILREPSAANEEIPLASAKTILWDNRWIVTSDPNAPKTTVKALGFPPHDVLDVLAPGLRQRIPQGRVRASLPALFEGDKLRWIPSFDGKGPFSMTFRKQAFP